MYAGQLVETGPTQTVLHRPRHPYTAGLMNSLPEAVTGRGRLRAIPGSPPDSEDMPPGCGFAPRCALAAAACVAGPIELVETSAGHWSRCLRTDRVDDLRPGVPAQEPAAP
jgi:oligopeptide/dipeptide ABC transporter ATP-binding protein